MSAAPGNAVNAPLPVLPGAATPRYAKCIAASKRIRWDIDHDVIRGRGLDFGRRFLPDALSKVNELAWLTPGEARFLSQVQARTYANVFALAERYIGAKTLELSRDYWFGDQVALEALVRFADEELKHQELFRRLERLAAAGMPPGYAFRARPDTAAALVLGKSTWAVLGLTLDLEIVSQAHYRASIEREGDIDELWKDVFHFHWKEESQHAVLDELEWRRADARLDAAARERSVGELAELFGSIDAMLGVQARADADYFAAAAGRAFRATERAAIGELLLRAYRWQFVACGLREPRFHEVLRSLATPAQLERFQDALAPLAAHAAA